MELVAETRIIENSQKASLCSALLAGVSEKSILNIIFEFCNKKVSLARTHARRIDFEIIFELILHGFYLFWRACGVKLP